MVNPIPEGCNSVNAYLVVKGAQAAVEFYQKAFDAEEVMRLEGPDGKIAHVEIQIGDSRVMMADEHPEMGALAPPDPGKSGVGLCLYVEDCDAVVQRAVDAGATLTRPVADQFYGDRSGMLIDPFGHLWTVATHKEDLTSEEINRRMAEMMG